MFASTEYSNFARFIGLGCGVSENCRICTMEYWFPKLYTKIHFHWSKLNQLNDRDSIEIADLNCWIEYFAKCQQIFFLGVSMSFEFRISGKTVTSKWPENNWWRWFEGSSFRVCHYHGNEQFKSPAWIPRRMHKTWFYNSRSFWINKNVLHHVIDTTSRALLSSTYLSLIFPSQKSQGENRHQKQCEMPGGWKIPGILSRKCKVVECD